MRTVQQYLVTIAGVAFDPQSIFKTGRKGCGNQQPLCKGLSEQHSSCSLPVVQVKYVDRMLILTLRGTATCAEKAACTDFKANAKPGSISIDAPWRCGREVVEQYFASGWLTADG